MASRILERLEDYGLPATGWLVVGIALVYVIWILTWNMGFRDFLVSFIVRLFKRGVRHPEILALHVQLYLRMFFFLSFVPITGVIIVLLGLWNDEIVTNTFLISGGFLTVASLIGMGGLFRHTFSGTQVLFTGAFGKGDYIRCEHAFGHKFEGWVIDVGMYSTSLLGPDYTQFVIANELLMEYTVENFDRSPFHMETFDIFYNSENQKQIERLGRETVTVSRESKKAKYGFFPLIHAAEEDDRQFFSQTFGNISDDDWTAIRLPNVIFHDQHRATLRVPVSNRASGKALRDMMMRSGFLETSSNE